MGPLTIDDSRVDRTPSYRPNLDRSAYPGSGPIAQFDCTILPGHEPGVGGLTKSRYPVSLLRRYFLLSDEPDGGDPRPVAALF